MPSDSQSAKQNPPPIPPRFTWLRRGALGFILLLLILLALRLWWGHEANRRIVELARAAYARGEPFYPEDFRQQPVPDEENAAILIQAAIDQTSPPTSWINNPDQWYDPAPLESELPEITDFVSKYVTERKLVRAARNLQRSSWNTVPAYELSKPLFGEYRKLATVLILSAKLERAHRQDGLAIEDVEDELALAQLSDFAYPEAYTHATAFILSNIGTSFICNSSMDLAISRNANSGATPPQVRAD